MIYIKEDIDMTLVQCQYEEEQGYIYIVDEYTNNILKLSGYNDIDDYDFQTMCLSNLLELHLYEYALKSAPNAYFYSRYVHNGRFELGEPSVAASTLYSYRYAKDILKGRFELGEPSVAASTLYSYRYAKDILKGRFELGEPLVADSPLYSLYYARDVLKGRFELGEQAIAGDINYKKQYERYFGITL